LGELPPKRTTLLSTYDESFLYDDRDHIAVRTHRNGTTQYRPPDTYGDSFANGWPESISSCGVGSMDAIQRTATHELGHHVRERIGGPLRENLETLWRQETEAGRHITDYAGDSAEEYFAESFTAFHYHPDELERRSPATIEFMFQAMNKAGIR
jgi:hypothetical protein